MTSDENFPEWKKGPIVQSNLNTDSVPKTTISAIFSWAGSLLNEKKQSSKLLIWMGD